MESESDEDFLSADEGDDEIANSSPSAAKNLEHFSQKDELLDDTEAKDSHEEESNSSDKLQYSDNIDPSSKEVKEEEMENTCGNENDLINHNEAIYKHNEVGISLKGEDSRSDIVNGTITATNFEKQSVIINDNVPGKDGNNCANLRGETSTKMDDENSDTMENSAIEKEGYSDDMVIKEAAAIDFPPTLKPGIDLGTKIDKPKVDENPSLNEGEPIENHEKDQICANLRELNAGNKVGCKSEDLVGIKDGKTSLDFTEKHHGGKGNGVMKTIGNDVLIEGEASLEVAEDGDGGKGNEVGETVRGDELTVKKSVDTVEESDVRDLSEKESLINHDNVIKKGENKKEQDVNFKKAVDQIASGEEDSWGWNWADNLISQAATKASSLIEQVEGQLGIPDPAEIAAKMKKAQPTEEKEGNESCVERKNCENADLQRKENSSSWFNSFAPVASISNIVQSKGQDLMTGGIDALEFIGKSTVSYLSDGDPGLRKKREFLFKDKGSTLSAVLQEAKVKAEERGDCGAVPQGEDPKKLNDMLEKFQAIAHLDALEMLSSECDKKLERILNVQSDLAKNDSRVLMAQIKDSFELEEKENCRDESVDFKKEIFAATKKLQVKVTCSKLLNTWSKLQEKTKDLSNLESSDICFESFISSLAELISRCVEYYRKVADMLMLTDMQANQIAVERAELLKRISEMFQCEISSLVDKFAGHLADGEEDKKSSDFITDIYLESSNASSLLRDSHMLVLPILQCSAIK